MLHNYFIVRVTTGNQNMLCAKYFDNWLSFQKPVARSNLFSFEMSPLFPLVAKSYPGWRHTHICISRLCGNTSPLVNNFFPCSQQIFPLFYSIVLLFSKTEFRIWKPFLKNRWVTGYLLRSLLYMQLLPTTSSVVTITPKILILHESTSSLVLYQ